MTLAAEELHLTHGAVSRHIKTLEEDLGVPLFNRLTRRIELTNEGARYFSVVHRFLTDLARETEIIRQRNDNSKLVISSGISFAVKWLTPRLHRLMAQEESYDVQMEVSENPLDFSSGSVDIALLYGNGGYPNASAERMLNETVSPMCSPAYLERMGGTPTMEELTKWRLIYEIGMNTTWERWFSMVGIPFARTRGPGFSHGSIAIEAAIRGEGVVLGRSVLVADDIEQGRLTTLFPKHRLEVEWGYDLVYRTGHQDHPKVNAVRNWIVRELHATEAQLIS